MDNEGVYMIHTRELHTLKLPIYKLGRSNYLDNRVKQYPNGSKILLMIYSLKIMVFQRYYILLGMLVEY